MTRKDVQTLEKGTEKMQKESSVPLGFLIIICGEAMGHQKG
jgi:hypothetical protein